MLIKQEGHTAFQGGIVLEAVPYDDHARRIQWLTGWFLSKREAGAISAPNRVRQNQNVIIILGVQE